MSNDPETWGGPEPQEEPTTLQEEQDAAVQRGEDYKAPTPRPDLRGEATEADVLDQAALAWQREDQDDPEVG